VGVGSQPSWVTGSAVRPSLNALFADVRYAGGSGRAAWASCSSQELAVSSLCVQPDAAAEHEGGEEEAAAVSPFVAWIGSPCLRYCVHGASIGGGRSWTRRCRCRRFRLYAARLDWDLPMSQLFLSRNSGWKRPWTDGAPAAAAWAVTGSDYARMHAMELSLEQHFRKELK
jgi:hypothetical protein